VIHPRHWLAGALVAGLSGCMVGPDYQRPQVEIPAVYKEAGGWRPAQPRDTEARGDWWAVFGDPQLDGLLAQVDISNQSLLATEAQYRVARALVRQAGAGLAPSLSGSMAVTRSRAPGSSTELHSYRLSLDAVWEVDLWGRIRRQREASLAGAQASAADLAAARLSARAELATDYFQLRALDLEEQLLNDRAAAFRKSLEITQNRYAAGVAGKIDVAQAKTQLKSTQAQAIDLGIQRAALEHAIAVMIGKQPADLALSVDWTRIAVPDVPLVLPADLLERRPDIAAAERRVAAANAQIGVARSAFFPSLDYSLSSGFQSATLAALRSTPSRVWSVGPTLAERFFDAGLRRALTEQAIASYDASAAGYRQTVLDAFQDVEDNLAALRILAQEAAVQDEAVEAARESVRLTLNQYKAGTVSYLSVVTVQTTQLDNERAALAIYGQRLATAVALIKALGGGWEVAE